MQITPGNLSFLFNMFRMDFQKAYLAGPDPFYTDVASAVQSATAQETYAWMARVPQLRTWLGERFINSVSTYGYTLPNNDYELSVELERNAVLDDQFGVFKMTVGDMARAAKQWPDKQLSALLSTLQSTTCYDGNNYFDTAHPVDKFDTSKGTYQNYWASGKALTPDNFGFVYQQMLSFKGEDGTPLGINPTHLLVPANLKFAAMQIVNASSIAPGTIAGGQTQVGANDNIYNGMVKLVVSPWLTEPNAWYLLDCSRGVKPFLFQQRQAPVFVQYTDPKSETVFRRRKFLYGVDARGGFGFTLPFLAAKASA